MKGVQGLSSVENKLQVESKSLRIGLFGNLGNGNLGDEACLVTTFQFLRERLPDARCTVFTTDANETRTRHGVEVFPANRDIDFNAPPRTPRPRSAAPPPQPGWKQTLKTVPVVWPTLKAVQNFFSSMKLVRRELEYVRRGIGYLKQLDWIGGTGGGQLADNFTGPWGYAYTLFRWSVLGRAMGKRVFYVAVGAASLKYPLSKIMGRIAFNLAHHRSFRDLTSRNIARGIGIEIDHGLCPDIVYGIDPRPFIEGPVTANPRLVAINIFPHYDGRYWPEDNPERYRHYLTVMRDFCDWLLRHDFEIVFFPSQVKADPRSIADLMLMLEEAALVAKYGARIHAPRIYTFNDFFTALAPAHYVVCTRFHGMIMSFVLGKPVLAIPNQPKMVDLMDSIGLSDYSRHIDQITPENLISIFNRMQAERDKIVQIVTDNVTRNRDLVRAQLERAFVTKI